MSQIERDIYVTRETILDPIQYVQGANAVPLVFHFRDFDIPSGAAARIYMRKVSGAEVYNDATISGNDITVDVTTQMSADAGWNKISLQVMNGDDILLSFPLVLDVKWSAVSNNSIESKDEFTALENAMNQVVPATEAANSAAASANAAAEAAEEATRDAQDATTDAETATQNANTATQSANAATSAANTAASSANQATEDANAAAEAANAAAEAVEGAVSGVIKDSQVSASTTYSSQKIEDDFLKKTGDASETTVSYESTTENTPPATGSALGTLVAWLVSKCTGIGNIANLLTVAKTNLVAAVNELRGEIGDLTQLETTEKTDLVAAINETNAGLSELNGNLAEAILIKNYSLDNFTIPGDSYETAEVNAPIITGYNRAIWWADCTNASSNGVNMSATSVYRISITTGDDTALVAVRNYSSSVAKVKVNLRMIYTRTFLN